MSSADVPSAEPQRLDIALTRSGLVTSRNRARREIEAGRVFVDGIQAKRASAVVKATQNLVVEHADSWVSRSAHKLLNICQLWNLAPVIQGAVCIDVGASTGGFTQVLLHYGAHHVVAVDVGHNQLASEIAADSRVTPWEGQNARCITPADIAEKIRGKTPRSADEITFAVADLSFISLTLILEPLERLLGKGSQIIALVKPQFECDRSALTHHGVITQQHHRAEAIYRVKQAAEAAGLHVLRCAPSGMPGRMGNREYFLQIHKPRDVDALHSVGLAPERMETPPRGITQEDIAVMLEKEDS